MGIKEFIRELVWPKWDDRILLLEAELSAKKELYDASISAGNVAREEIVVLTDKVAELSTGYEELLAELQSYENRLEENKYDKPSWLDTSKKSYIPRRMVTTKVKQYYIQLSNQRSIYNPFNPSIIDFVKLKEWNLIKDLDKRAYEIWKYVINHLKYEYDFFEDWIPSYVSLYADRGDCEDGSILFVDLCRASGIPPNRIFNATGWVSWTKGGEKFGHAFPIFKRNDGKWWIYETVIDNVPSKPKRFFTSLYDCSWGLANDVWQGKLKGGGKQI